MDSMDCKTDKRFGEKGKKVCVVKREMGGGEWELKREKCGGKVRQMWAGVTLGRWLGALGCVYIYSH